MRPVSVTVGQDSTEVVLDLEDYSEVYEVLDRLARLGIGIVSFEQIEQIDAEKLLVFVCIDLIKLFFRFF